MVTSRKGITTSIEVTCVSSGPSTGPCRPTTERRELEQGGVVWAALLGGRRQLAMKYVRRPPVRSGRRAGVLASTG